MLVPTRNLDSTSRFPFYSPRLARGTFARAARKFNSYKFKMKDLIERRTLTAELARQLEQFVIERKNILICSGTASGKTTLANILIESIPDSEPIVLIEDTAEIEIQKPNDSPFRGSSGAERVFGYHHSLPFESNSSSLAGLIIVGEIRSGEPFDFLQRLNIGHSGLRLSISKQPCCIRLLLHRSCGTERIFRHSDDGWLSEGEIRRVNCFAATMLLLA